MGYPQIDFTPRGGSAISVQFQYALRQVTSWKGGQNPRRGLTVTYGGKAACVVHDIFEEYEVTMLGVRPSASAAYRSLFSRLQTWWEHAAAGGEFAWTLDHEQKSSTTLTGSLVYNTNVLDVVSTTGFASGHWVTIEDAVDPTKWTKRQVDSIVSGVRMTLTDVVDRPFATSSVVRHALYLPKAICLTDEMPFRESEGVDRWDFRAVFRTVR